MKSKAKESSEFKDQKKSHIGLEAEQCQTQLESTKNAVNCSRISKHLKQKTSKCKTFPCRSLPASPDDLVDCWCLGKNGLLASGVNPQKMLLI